MDFRRQGLSNSAGNGLQVGAFLLKFMGYGHEMNTKFNVPSSDLALKVQCVFRRRPMLEKLFGLEVERFALVTSLSSFDQVGYKSLNEIIFSL